MSELAHSILRKLVNEDTSSLAIWGSELSFHGAIDITPAESHYLMGLREDKPTA